MQTHWSVHHAGGVAEARFLLVQEPLLSVLVCTWQGGASCTRLIWGQEGAVRKGPTLKPKCPQKGGA